MFVLLCFCGTAHGNIGDFGRSSLAARTGGTETVQRWMSRAELEATQQTGLLLTIQML